MPVGINTHEPKRAQDQSASAKRTHGGLIFSPRIDIWETEDALRLCADMPGVSAETVDIQFEDRELRIHGRVVPRQQGVNYLYSEYEIGDFHRTFSIGQSIDAERITAEVKDGVLTLRLPKIQVVRPRRIAVKSG